MAPTYCSVLEREDLALYLTYVLSYTANDWEGATINEQ